MRWVRSMPQRNSLMKPSPLIPMPIENNPDNAGFYMNRANVYLDLEDFDNALDDYKQRNRTRR